MISDYSNIEKWLRCLWGIAKKKKVAKRRATEPFPTKSGPSHTLLENRQVDPAPLLGGEVSIMTNWTATYIYHRSSARNPMPPCSDNQLTPCRRTYMQCWRCAYAQYTPLHMFCNLTTSWAVHLWFVFFLIWCCKFTGGWVIEMDIESPIEN